MKTRQNHTDAHAQRQLFFLQRVYEKREVLFGRRDRSSIAVQQGPSKEEEWEKLRKECVDNGMSELANKSYKHLRDVTWQNFRRRAAAKWEKIKNKPKGEEELTDCDKLALAIVNDLSVAPNYQQAPDYDHEEIVDDEFYDDSDDSDDSREASPVANGTVAELRRVKREPDEAEDANQFAPLPADYFEDPRNSAQPNRCYHAMSGDLSRPPPPRSNLYDDDDDEETAHVPQFVVQPTAVNRHVPNGTIGSSHVDPATAEREDAVLKSLKRKRQIADIRNVDAQTERLLADGEKLRAEAEKLRAEAKLARMQAAEIETRLHLQLNGTPAARLRESNGEIDVVE